MKLLLCPLVLLALSVVFGVTSDAQEGMHPVSADTAQNPGALLGAGNFTNGSVDKNAEAQFQLLRTVGGMRCRVNLYPSLYLTGNDWEKPNPACMDAILQTAHRQGITPMILFEFYSEYEIKGPIKLGAHAQWMHLGKAFADYCRPNGIWGRAHGVKDWGVTVYTAFNEPDGGDFKVGGALGPTRYVESLKGLGDGVHSASKTLAVLPGGFLSPNAYRDWTLRGLGPALSSLWNDGTLDGIDLHTYYDVQYAPMEKTYDRSAQNNFDQVKKACGITRDIHFYSTEFNYKKRLVDEDQAAKGFLTGLWDNLGVVKNDGKTGATVFAFPWNLFNATQQDKEYGMRLSFDPPVLTRRGQVLQTVLQLTQGMTFQSRDPRGKGEYILTGAGKKLWVWQDRTAWTNHLGTTYTVTGIPRSAKKLEVYAWDGLRKTLPLSGVATLILSDLQPEETYLFLAR